MTDRSTTRQRTALGALPRFREHAATRDDSALGAPPTPPTTPVPSPSLGDLGLRPARGAGAREGIDFVGAMAGRAIVSVWFPRLTGASFGSGSRPKWVAGRRMRPFASRSPIRRPTRWR